MSEDDELYEESRGSSPIVPIKKAGKDTSSRVSQDEALSSKSSQPTSPADHGEAAHEQREQWRDQQLPRRTEIPDVSPIREENDALEGEDKSNGEDVDEVSDQDQDQDRQSEERQVFSSDEEHERAHASTPSPTPLNGPIPSPPSQTTSPRSNGRFTPTMNQHVRQWSKAHRHPELTRDARLPSLKTYHTIRARYDIAGNLCWTKNLADLEYTL